MLLIRNRAVLSRINCFTRLLCSDSSKNDAKNYADKIKTEHPATRTFKILKNDVKNMKNIVTSKIDMWRQVQSEVSNNSRSTNNSAAEHIIRHRQSYSQDDNFQVRNKKFFMPRCNLFIKLNFVDTL